MTKQMAVRLPDDVFERLKSLSKKNGPHCKLLFARGA